MRQVLSKATCILLAGVTVTLTSAYCFKLVDCDCLQSINYDDTTCTLVSGVTYPCSTSVDKGETGWSEHVSDGWEHCAYDCNGVTEWLVYGMKRDPNTGHLCTGI